MIDRSSIKQSLLQLAEEVHSCDTGASVRLRLLATAIENGQDADVWSKADMHSLISPDSIVEQYKSQQARGKWIDILELARNTLVLGPIIVTWFGISQATAKYNELLNELLISHPNQVSQPFLYLWEQGFGGKLPSILTLSNLALIDAGILLFIFVLTFLTFSFTQANVNRAEREAQSLHANLVHSLAGATLYLLGQQRPQLLTAGDNLDGVARKIDDMATQATTRLNTMVEQMVNQFTTMTNQVTQHFSGMSDQIVARFNAMAQQLENQAVEGRRYLDTLNSFAGGLQQISQEMNATAQKLGDTNKELIIGVNDLVAPARALADQQKNLTDVATGATAHLQDVARLLTELGRKQDHWGADLTDVLDTLNIAVEKAVQLATSVGQFTLQQKDFLQHLEQQQDAQRVLATLMSESTVNLREALGDMQSGGKALRSMAHDMNDILNMQRSANTSDILRGYATAAQTIEKSGGTLNASAIAIYQASQKLTEVIEELENRFARIK